jgi:hypothetical protein
MSLSTQLPRGQWIILEDVPLGSTATEISDWLNQFGFQTTAESVAMGKYGTHAIVSIEDDDVLAMFQGVVNGCPFNGKVPKIRRPQKRG